MDKIKLEKSIFLHKQIKLTKAALESSYKFNEAGANFKEELYNMHISEFSDGSGSNKIKLSGMTSFNSKFLESLKSDLEKHLKELESEFERL